MPSFELNGTTYETDEDGYLVNLNDWNEEVAGYLAQAENVDMTPAHWEVVHFLREYYEEYKIAPMIRILTKAIGKKMGKDKGNTKYLYDLYPGGPAKQACKVAGLPKPTGCV
ncbi:TusE/DsrC/DsvC family sulfur relay protein [Magnetococcales bacterium HHB-1]